MLRGETINLWENARAEGLAEDQRETMQKLFIKGEITYEDLVELLGKEGAEAIRDIRDKTEETLGEE